MRLFSERTFKDIADHVDKETGKKLELYLNKGKVKDLNVTIERCGERCELDAIEPNDKEAKRCLLASKTPRKT